MRKLVLHPVSLKIHLCLVCMNEARGLGKTHKVIRSVKKDQRFKKFVSINYGLSHTSHRDWTQIKFRKRLEIILLELETRNTNFLYDLHVYGFHGSSEYPILLHFHIQLFPARLLHIQLNKILYVPTLYWQIE